MGLGRLPQLALRERRKGLAQQLPPVTDILRGSLVERYVTCGNPACGASLEVLPSNARPVRLWPDRDSAWSNVAEGIKRMIIELRQRANRG